MRWYKFVFFRKFIIFDMFGGVGLDSASSGLVLLLIDWYQADGFVMYDSFLAWCVFFI